MAFIPVLKLDGEKDAAMSGPVDNTTFCMQGTRTREKRDGRTVNGKGQAGLTATRPGPCNEIDYGSSTSIVFQ